MEAKRHHYVPRFYLNYFAAPSQKGKKPIFWVYDKDGNRPRPQTPENTAVAGYLYSLDAPEGKRDTTIERFFSYLETVAKPVLDRWQLPKAKPEPHEMPIIAGFLAFLHFRVPRSMDLINELGVAFAVEALKDLAGDPQTLKKTWDRFREQTQTPSEMTLEGLRDTILNLEERFRISMNPKAAMLLSLDTATDVIPELLAMNWCLCRAPRAAFFITSDSPVNVFVRKGQMAGFGAGFRHRTLEVAFPISPEICLYLDRRRNQARQGVAERFVREINRRTAYMAERFIISPYNSRRIQELVDESAFTRDLPKTDREEVRHLYGETMRRRQVNNKGESA